MMIINIASIPVTAFLWSWIAKSPPKPMWSLSLDIITVIKSHLQLSWTATTAISKCHGCRLSSLLDLPVTGAGIKLQGFGYMFVCLIVSLSRLCFHFSCLSWWPFCCHNNFYGHLIFLSLASICGGCCSSGCGSWGCVVCFLLFQMLRDLTSSGHCAVGLSCPLSVLPKWRLC